MCIVSLYMPNDSEFLLTHNRDELIAREFSQKAETKIIHGKEVTSPVDSLSGGTWIYTSKQYVSCILNGEYKKHKRNLPYRMSRGLLILELLKYPKIDDFINEINLNQIEAFTLLMIDRLHNEKKVLVWDEKEKHREEIKNQNLWVRSSSPLYDEIEKKKNQKAFELLISEGNTSFDDFVNLHKKLSMPKNDKFPGIQTTSITQINTDGKKSSLQFCPFLAE